MPVAPSIYAGLKAKLEQNRLRGAVAREASLGRGTGGMVRAR